MGWVRKEDYLILAQRCEGKFYHILQRFSGRFNLYFILSRKGTKVMQVIYVYSVFLNKHCKVKDDTA